MTKPLFHAVLWLDHHGASLQQFDAGHAQDAEKLHASSRHSKQHGNAVRTEHEFYAEVCAALQGIGEVLATGSNTALADFRHYVERHRPALVPHIAGYEVVDHPSDKQLLALARQFFLRHDRMAGLPTPT